MKTITDQLRKIVELCNYINQCPPSCRELVIRTELEEIQNNLDCQPSYPVIELRWLTFNLKIEEESSLERKFQFIKAANSCERVIEAIHLQQQKDIIKDKQQLIELIQQQHKLIFNRCLLNATQHYLENDKDDDTSFSANTILLYASDHYKKLMHHEALYQFETLCLIERYDFLVQKKEYGKKNLIDNFVTINYEINPELDFIAKKLNTTDLLDLKLHATQELQFYLEGTEHL